MTLIHRLPKLSRVLSVLAILVILPSSLSTFAAARPRAKSEKHRSEKRQTHKRQTDKRPTKRQSLTRGSRAEKRRAQAARRAEAMRQTAAARQREGERAAEEPLRERVQSMIARDDITGEDPEIRRIAVNALGNHAGTVVVMDPKSGRIYSIVNQQWALHEGFKPCSTIKLVTGLAGLNEKVIDPANTAAISDSNRVDLTHALAYSKNDYFQQVGGQVGFAKMISYAHRLGLGEKTGINVRNEFSGRMPAFKSGFAVNHMSSHGDDFKVTAVQLATLVSAIANGGSLLTPFVARTQREESRVTPNVRRSVNIEADSFKHMLPGMAGSVSYGSGRRAFDPQETVLGKTGTCIEQGMWVGLFTSYAPLKDPKLAVVVIARGADGRNHFPAAVAGRIYRELSGRFGTAGVVQVAKRDPNDRVKSNTTLAAEEANAADDEEETEEADDNSTATVQTAAPVKIAPQTIWGAERMPADSKVKRVLMPIPSRKTETSKPAVSNDTSNASPQTMERARRVLSRQN